MFFHSFSLIFLSRLLLSAILVEFTHTYQLPSLLQYHLKHGLSCKGSVNQRYHLLIHSLTYIFTHYSLPSSASSSKSCRKNRYLSILSVCHCYYPVIITSLGCGLGGTEDLKSHPFFQSVDWSSVVNSAFQSS